MQYQIELFTENLNSLSSNGDSKKKDPAVSFHLSVMGQKLKIVNLFKGYSAMLSTVWKLPTKLTSIFDINFLIADQNEYLILQNGMIIKLGSIGSSSIDLSGITDISLWSQYAKIGIVKRFYFKFKLKIVKKY